MKPLTEKPPEPVMRFFTPELFLRFNAPADDEADRADEDWEAAIRAYRAHLVGLRDRLPEPVKRLVGLDLHDAELLAVDQPIDPAAPSAFGGLAVLSVRQGDAVVSLIYTPCGRVRRHPPRGPWPFSGSRAHWLYDEVDVTSAHPDLFLHRVLLSDGSVLEIPFVSALVHSIPLPAEVSKQIA